MEIISTKCIKWESFIVMVLCVILSFSTSCKNEDIVDSVNQNLSEARKEQNWSLEVFKNMKDIYLWNDVLPSTFDTVKYATAESALNYLSGLKKNSSGVAIDRYSFLDKIGSLSSEISQGTASGDYGFMVTGVLDSTTKVVSFVVNYVYKNSPAGLAGVARSYEVVEINGSTDVHPTIGSDGYLETSSKAYQNMSNALFNSSSAKFMFKRPDGTTLDVSLNTGSYTINAILCDSVYSVSSTKVGYVVFNQFLGTTAQTELTNVMTKFESKGVEYVIVDLRYNGGGAVSTCEMFSNLLAPKSATAKVMYKYSMNAQQTSKYTSQSLITNYNKTNSFQPKAIYFIVGSRTASASELLINNLRPYFPGNIYLIGKTTYGKPCGFWATPIGYTEKQTSTKEGYDLYAVSFSMVNANGEGGYYSGMTPGSVQYPGTLAVDGLYPWADTNDGCLSQAIYHVANGVFKSSKSANVKSLQTKTVFNTLDRQFNGMIDFKGKPF